MQEKQEKSKQSKPVQEFRIGFVKAAVWKHHNPESGGRFFNVTFCRLYKKDGAQWASTESFGRDDLLAVSKVADQAHSWICAQGTDDRAVESRPESAEGTTS